MTSAGESSNSWDFGPVYNLIHALSYDPSVSKDGRTQSQASAKGDQSSVVKEVHASGPETANGEARKSTTNGGGISLGNFDRIWDHLGVRRDLPAPNIPALKDAKGAPAVDHTAAYTSDGAIWYPASSKTVKWKEDYDAGADTAADADEESYEDGEKKNLTKNQKRKLRRARNKSASVPNREIGVIEAMVLERQAAAWSGSDTETNQTTPKRKTKSPENSKTTPKTAPPQTKKPAGYQSDFTPTTNRFFLRSKDKGGKDISAPSPSAKKSQRNADKKGPSATTSNGLNKNRSTKQYETTEVPAIRLHEQLQKQYKASGDSLAFMPTQALRYANSKAQDDNLSHVPTIKTTRPLTGNRSYDIAPLRPRDDLNWVLLKKLIDDFPEDRTHLVSPLQLSINRPKETGIHVFVDASNILIGFEENLKRARGIPIETRLPRHPDFHFHALALLLERRRPILKRVLAGSAPEIPAFDQAREVGYETCILDKVWKAKELTDRQRYFAARDQKRLHAGYKSGNESSGDALSYDETAAAAAATMPRPKWVEQAVDEILHLKMLESIVDTQIPGEAAAQVPVMVLATGDAAEAEYSSGFLKMVMRALNAGWHVELVAWARNISSEYRKLERKSTWKGKFMVVELDSYCEELFGEAV